jgi:hypothetical protein
LIWLSSPRWKTRLDIVLGAIKGGTQAQNVSNAGKKSIPEVARMDMCPSRFLHASK